MSVIKIPTNKICIIYKKNSTLLHNIFLQAIDQLSDFLVKMIFSLSFSFPLAQLSWGMSMLAIDLKLSPSEVNQALYSTHPTQHLVLI